MSDAYDAEERCLREMLAMLQESYVKAAKPYIDQLVTIHSMRPPRPFVVPMDQVSLAVLTKQAQSFDPVANSVSFNEYE